MRSRFEVPGLLDRFLGALAALGFKLQSRDESDTMFAVYLFSKQQQATARPPAWPALKPCEYKRR